MSWNFSVSGTTKEEAKAAVMSDPSVAEWKYCPLAVAEGICKAIDGLAEPEADQKLIVSTYGHVYGPGCGKQHGDNANVSLSYGPR